MQTGVTVAQLPQAAGNAIPEEILARWSWGPFFLGVLWVWWNADQKLKIAAAVIFVCCWIPFINFIGGLAALAFAIYLGLKGNRTMAANRQFQSTEQFVAVQTAWAKWGVIVFIVDLALIVISMFMFGAAMVAAGMHSSS